METDAALVGADGIVVLHAIAGVHLHIAVVISPCYAECEDSVGDTEALDEIVRLKFGVFVVLLLN